MALGKFDGIQDTNIGKLVSLPSANIGSVGGNALSAAPDAYTKLLLHMDGTEESNTFVDSSQTPKTVTPYGNARTVSGHQKFGATGGYFGSASDYLSIPTSTDFEVTGGDFTIDFWTYSTQYPVSGEAKFFVSYGVHANGQTWYEVSFGEDHNVWVALYNSGYIILIASSTNLPLNQLVHIAVVRSGNTVSLYFNGVLKGSTIYSGSYTPTGKTLWIGYNSSGGHGALASYIDELRISKGIARWTTDFTPPTSPY